MFSKKIWVFLLENLTSHPEKNMATSQPSALHIQRKENMNAASTLHVKDENLAKLPSSSGILDMAASAPFIVREGASVESTSHRLLHHDFLTWKFCPFLLCDS